MKNHQMEGHVGIGRDVSLSYEEAIQKVEKALKAEGFGVLTRIDVKATLKEKLGVDISPFVILGACNPTLAHQALLIEPEVGLLLPCNVVVREIGGGKVRVEALNPRLMSRLFQSDDVNVVASTAGEKIDRVIATI
jgi:uncharacterized protein (DUF302 family)